MMILSRFFEIAPPDTKNASGCQSSSGNGIEYFSNFGSRLMRQPIHILMLLLSVLLLPIYASQQRQIPITVEVQPTSKALKSGEPLLLRVTISNGLSQDIRFQTFSLSPNSWNAEITNISLVDIYRDVPQPMNLLYARPRLGETPKYIAGMSSYAIKPQETLSVVIDISKWQIRDGWAVGKYKVTIRADNIYVDKYTTASVMSEMIEIEIK
jgi:hypothetical protein